MGLAGAGWAWSTTARLRNRRASAGPSSARRAAATSIALTYDDGPNTAWTPALLEVLERYGVKATFFSIGHFAEEQPELLLEVAAAGHAVGNHTYSHVTMPFHTDAAIREELRKTTEAIEGAGVEMARALGRRLMRPPYGRRRPGTLRVLA